MFDLKVGRLGWIRKSGGRVTALQSRRAACSRPYTAKKTQEHRQECLCHQEGSRFGVGVPHFLLDFPLAGGVFVEDEENFAVAFHRGLIGGLEALRLEAPF